MNLRASLILMSAFAVLGCAGCVERRFVIVTEPFGAMVYDWSDVPIGKTPADKPFTYYGTYRFKIMKDGYKTMIVEEKVKAPWYEWPLLDFVSENLLPFTVRDRRELHYQLEPIDPLQPKQVVDEGEILRQRGKTIGTPLPTQQPVVTPVPPPPPPANLQPPAANLPFNAPPPAPVSPAPAQPPPPPPFQ